MAELRWAGTLLIKDHPLVAIHICPCPYQEEIEMFQHGVNDFDVGIKVTRPSFFGGGTILL